MRARPIGAKEYLVNWLIVLWGTLVLVPIAHADSGVTSAASGPVFEISFPSAARAQPVTGRLFVMISRVNEPEVRLQSHWFNSPQMTAIDVSSLHSGDKAVIDAGATGFPFRSLAQLPQGEYYVQAVMNVYTRFERADGHVVLAHMDQWEGQQFNRSPGNLYSKVQRLKLDPARAERFQLSLSEVIAPIQVPPDTAWVKYIKLKSERLSRFWGRPIYLGAVVLLPRDYASQPGIRYPVIYYQQGHFSLRAPFGFTTEKQPEKEWDRREREKAGYETGYEFGVAWRSEQFPRMIAVALLHATPFADMSGVQNSVNNGPYGDAIMEELIPHIEAQFRTIREPYARLLVGKASGGRDALNLQLRYPEFFGGMWAFHPWAFNFQRYFSLDIYDNDNAFEVKPADIPDWARNPSGWLPVERYLTRLGSGTPIATFRQLSLHDAVMASEAGGEFGIDDAIHSPIGTDGYPRPLWDRFTGKIDREVADYWREHGDLAYYTEKNWSRIGRHLVGKLHFYTGDQDTFERNVGLHLYEEFLKTTQDPHYEGTFGYGPILGEWQPMTNAQLIGIMAEHVARNAPTGARLPQ